MLVHEHQKKATEGESPRSKDQSRGRHTPRDFIDSALALCDRDGAQAITARRIAKEMDLSPMALYRHFKSMEHLQALIWNEGFSQLSAELARAYEAGGAGQTGLRRVFEVYVRFGIDNPGLYQLMFSVGPRPEEFGEANRGTEAFGRLIGRIAELQEAQTEQPRGGPHTQALNVWFSLHGLTTLAISGQVLRVTSLGIGEIIESTTDYLVSCL